MAVNFPTGSDYLSATFLKNQAVSNDLTIMCWGYLPSIGGSSYRVYLSTIGPGIAIETYTDGTTVNFSTKTADFLGRPLEAGIWYHLAMSVRTRTSTNHLCRGYVNGQFEVEGTDTSIWSLWTGVRVGCYESAGTSPLIGKVKDVRMWRRILDAREIQLEYRSGVPINNSGLLLYSAFDDYLVNDESVEIQWTANGSPTLESGPMVAYPKRRRL
jgi:hypothetical protein